MAAIRISGYHAHPNTCLAILYPMINTKRAYNGMVTAPHHLASQAGLRVLQEGGNAVEAMIAAAATIAVVYPHMNGLGGDNFWLIHAPGKDVKAIDACGAAATKASIDFYQQNNCQTIPERGPLAALTMAGAVSGWQNAFNYSQQALNGKLPLQRLLEDAMHYANTGVAVTGTLANNARGKLGQLKNQPGFADVYMHQNETLSEGSRLVQKRIGQTMQALVDNGLDDFYRGDLARSMASDLEKVGSPISLADFSSHNALEPDALKLNVAGHTVYNMPPPTQGLASLLLLGVFEKLGRFDKEDADFVHALVEATKTAFRIRDAYVSDPAYMTATANSFLNNEQLTSMANSVDPERAAPWPDAATSGDTVWLGAIDKFGNAVSFIQSIYWEFGSGVILAETGITWQNRGTSFSLDTQHHNHLLPGRRPFHTIQPALARLSDGRVFSYGTMGGEGQPQTQAMLFARYVMNNMPLQETVSAPRWLLGRTWGSEATNLRIENRFDTEVYQSLIARGHDLEMVGEFEEIMGHAGALVYHPDGLIEGAADPRSDGCAAAF